MAHRDEEEQKDGVLENGNVTVKTGGVSRISAYEVTSWAFRKLISAGKKAPSIPRKAQSLISGLGKSGKTHRLNTKIAHVETKIRRLHYKIGKAGISYSGEGNVLETEPVKALIAEVREKEARIEEMKARIIETKKEKKKKRAVRKKSVAIREETIDKRDIDTIAAAIDDAVLFGEFGTSSEKEIFQKIAGDLLDSEIEVRILAVAELGKMGKEAAVPVLLEASKSNNGDLVSEIINSLISLGDLRAIPLFRERASDPGYRVRIGCLRGLYKLADYEDDIPVLTEALRDDHPEVRRTAATFLGWKDRVEAAPALTQCLRDEDRRVRKAAVSALAHLKDEASVLPLIRVLADEEVELRKKALQTIRMISGNDEITFDVYADESAMAAAVDDMRNWWEQERLERVYEGRTDVELIKTEMMEAETTIEDVPPPVEETEASDGAEMPLPEDIDIKTEDVYDGSALGEDTVSEEKSGDEADALEALKQKDVGTASEEQPSFDESVNESVEEIIGEDAVSEEKTEDASDAAEGETPVDEADEEDRQYREEQLKRMVKAELLSICHDLGIDADESLLKSDLIALVLDGKE